jgi:hypothetical protein
MTIDRVEAQIAYLLAFPWDAAIEAESPLSIKGLRDAPYFTPIDIDVESLGAHTLEADGVPVTIRRTVYEEHVLMAECLYTLPDALGRDSLQRRLRIQAELKAHLLRDQPDHGDMLEEYTVLMLATIAGTPDDFIARNAQALASFIRSQREALTPDEIHEILMSRVRYSESELTLVDWEGALITSTVSDFQSDLELLKIGNYQLLRYRMLEQLIDWNLEIVRQNLRAGERVSLLPNPAKRMLRQVIEQRLALMLDFEKIDEGLLLIGDWYTAKLYRVIYDEFYLDEWAAAIKSKLNNLESIIQIIQDNFTFSWSRFLEFVQITGWLLLLVGYFILFFLEAGK